MREEILNSAQKLIQRKGINGMSYADISKEVNIKKASIHHHFPTKEDLVNCLLERYCAEFKTHVDEILSSPLKPKTKLQRFMSLFEETLLQGNNDRACLCGMLCAELLSISEQTASLVKEFFNESERAISLILEEGVKQKSFSIPGNIKNVSDLFLATLEGGIFLSRINGGPERYKKLLNQLEKTISA